MPNTLSLPLNVESMAEAARAASRQLWLASLGAASVTRTWVREEAGSAFRSLVDEGAAIETRAIHLAGRELENSITRANALWRATRSTVERAVRDYAAGAVSFAEQILPRRLPRIEAFAGLAPIKPAKKAAAARAKSANARGRRPGARAKRARRAA